MLAIHQVNFWTDSTLQERRAAIDPYFRAGNFAGSIGDEERHKLRDLLGFGRLAISQGNIALWILYRKPDFIQVFSPRVLTDLGLDRPGTDDIHPNVVRRQFEREHLCQSNLSCL